KEMVESWTTAGLKKGMKRLFDGARETMDQVATQADQTRRLVQAIYRKFHRDHGLPELSPKPFNIEKFNAELAALYREAEAFRNSPVTTMTEQSFVVKKFFISLVSHARNIFFRANQESEAWLKQVLAPLAGQIKGHKHQMEKRLETLRKINQSRETLDAKIAELEAETERLSEDLTTLDRLAQTLEHPVPFEVVSSEQPESQDSRAAL
ncbi:MAG: hypothetical protein GWN84_14245, partial [Gammaproteobacteria bacterium]|nr:hypothetical protein [Gammaproteobacteria bacterium]NIR83960.1 hypothetical protein [Gammaproteobacteria bacterium]NIU05258.1 hypothetical protein [Gammaproteobacteria bacterium]NIV74246.1 hypothetical protein [Gammaproteobacteria bacterium]NIX86531.1 hypothetical protein [Gammaproteobacteria bacterium]